MLKKFYGTLVLSPLVFAGRQQIEEALVALSENSQAQDPNNGLGRSLQNFLPGTFTDGYACWCTFDGVKKGKGIPEDELDQICRSLHQNYECMEQDTENNVVGACADKPWLVDYSVTMNMYIKLFEVVTGTATEQEVFQECVNGNRGRPCAINVCKIEMAFSARFMIKMSTVPYNLALQHRGGGFNPNGGGFDPLTQCQTRQGQPGDRHCCGPAYPDKFVYRNPFGGTRSCCVDHTFDSAMLECCPDGISRAIGDCP